MDTQASIVDWAKKMGYTGKIPDNFKVVCNASTDALWSQIVNKVKPHETVQQIRRNLIVRQLAATSGRNNTLNCALNLLPPNLEEVNLAGAKRQLLDDVESARELSEMRERDLDNVSRQNKTLYIQIESIEKNTLEHESNTYLYEKKAQDIIKEISAAEERLTLCRNLTPVEDCGEQHGNVLEDLNKCAAKLKAFTHSRQPFESSDSSISQNTSVVSAKRTPCKYGNYFTESFKSYAHRDKEMAALRQHEVQEDVEAMLRKQNRGEIWNALCRVEEEKRIDLIKFIIQSIDGEWETCHTKVDHLSKLYSIHIEKELEAMRCNLLIVQLEKQIERRLKGIEGILLADGYSAGVIAETNAILAGKKEGITLSTALGVLLKSLDDLMLVEGNGKELQQLQAKTLSVQSEIVSTVRNLLYRLDIFQESQKWLCATRDETFFLIRKLQQFTANLSWTSPLQDNLITHEVHLFKNFCLDYNRKFTFTKREGNCSTSWPCKESLDAVVGQLSLVLDKPNCYSETMLVDILRDKFELNKLDSLSATPLVLQSETVSIEKLQEQETYINRVLPKLLQLVKTENPCKKTMSSSKLQEVMKIWYEMPIKDLVSANRMFEGNNYKHFEQLYDSICNKI